MNVSSFGRPLRVAVLAGGDSAEREISLRSGAAVAQALCEAGHQTVAIDLAGRDLESVDWTRIDVCFLALHGGAGEDGRVQQQLSRLGVPYTGSGPDACRLAMSKTASKQRFVERGVPTLPWATIDVYDALSDPLTRCEPLGYPLVVKPDGQGSSLGVAVADDAQSLAAAVEAASLYDEFVLVEPLVRGREFTVAVLGERALPMIEVVSPARVFSYEAKYASAQTEYRFDFELPTRTHAALLVAATGAAQALGTSGLVRVDLMVGDDQRVWVLEVNTIPGLTPRSLAPLAAQRAGLPMAALCDALLRHCLETAEVA
ncbi:MAG: D-alanine--D-alanine ligase [Pirellulales bacterium]